MIAAPHATPGPPATSASVGSTGTAAIAPATALVATTYTGTASSPDELTETTNAYRRKLYQWLETQAVGPFVLGETISALDVYIACMFGWRPREAWFEAETPKLAAAARRTRAAPALAAVMAVNFPA